MEYAKRLNTDTDPLSVGQNQSHKAQDFSDTCYHSKAGSKPSILVQSLKISPCQRSMWYFHRMIVIVTLWIMCCCSSEAFASRSNNSFFGRKLSTVGFFRGGSSSTSSASSSSTTTTKKSASDSSTSTLTCVMQAPPRITSTINGGFNNDDNRYNEKKRKNGVEQPSSVIPNGVSFYRPSVSREKELRNPNVSVQDVITAAVHVAETKLPTDIGQFQLRAYRILDTNGNNNLDQPMAQQEPCVIYSRDKPPFGNSTHLAQHVPVRIHDQCLTSEVFGSQR
jgi:GTP cyclohydrolase II